MQIRQLLGIKEIIKDFPSVAAILQEYGIECATCSVGICQLKDVLEIHSLPDDQARLLMERIETVFSGNDLNSDPVTENTLKPSSCNTDTLWEENSGLVNKAGERCNASRVGLKPMYYCKS